MKSCKIFVKVMNQCIKYLSALNLISVASNIIGNNFFNIRNPNADFEFQQLFKWRPLKQGFHEAKSIEKPVFLFIYKPHCPACVKLKEKFSKSMRLIDLCDRFVMINAEMGTDATLKQSKFEPDGKYVPRILFFTPDGDLIEEAYNKHKDADVDHKYFYKSPSQIVETMLFVLKNYSDEPLSVTFQHEQSLKPESYDTEDDNLVPTL